MLFIISLGEKCDHVEVLGWWWGYYCIMLLRCADCKILKPDSMKF